MKTLKTTILVLLVLGAFLTAIASFPAVQATGENWLTGWIYRKSHVITHAAGASTNYQVPIIIKNSSSADSGNTVCINNKSLASFADIRFTASDGSTLLYCWNETFYSGLNVTVWVKIAADLSSADYTLFIYYGNVGATAIWDGPNTFIFFDDFLGTTLNATQWATNGGTVKVQNSLVNVTSTTSNWYGILGKLGPYKYVRWESNCSVQLQLSPAVYEMAGLASTYDPNTGTNNMTVFYGSAGTNETYTRNTTAASSPKVFFTNGINGYSIKALTWNSSTVQYYDNSTTSVKNETTDVPTGNMTPIMESYVTAGVVYMDWVFVSKFNYPEPANGAWGSETGLVPQYDLTQSGTNSTLSVSTWLFYLFWFESAIGTDLSGYIFSYNATSPTFSNDTWTAFSATNNSFSNATHVISNVVGSDVCWQVFANDSANNWAVSSFINVIVTANVTFYFDTGGTLARNETVLTNGTSTIYNTLTPHLDLMALANATYTFLNFSWGYGSSTFNNYVFMVTNTTIVWAHFDYFNSTIGPYIFASFTWSPSNPNIGDWVTFDARASRSSGAIQNYTWDLGYGSWSTEVTGIVQTQYSANATFQVRLIVGGNVGNSSQLTLPIVVGWGANHTDPGVYTYAVARFDFTPSNPAAATLITFNGSQSYATSAISIFSWNFDDGNVTSTGTTNWVIHAFAADGLYNVTLTVTAAVTNMSAFTFQLLNVSTSATAPTVYTYAVARFELSPSNPGNTTLIVFNGSQSYATDAISNFRWNFGDGNTTDTGATDWVSHVFGIDGQYNVTLTVTASVTNMSAFTFHLLTVMSGSVSAGYGPRPSDMAGLLIGGFICVILLIAVLILVRGRRH